MKQLIVLFFILFSASLFAQNTGLVVGKILDKEMDNTPLAFANVSVKGSSLKATSDFSGMFLLENLQDGEYTLVCNFPGYEPKEINIVVDSAEPTEIKLALGAFMLPSQMETASIESPSEKKALKQTTTSLN
ncbi:carboxypeptidase-like regulatory domain-containing protein [Seonamhaeicola sediminis]|uniref:Carboxypeptidase-like regulatory domain-containing protein n=1 Tax=Seonamhaeicola sediminis TaxID=2528206 RepID=A0A562YAL0_9FLAO|nr:carboxypeptidase-like regulatory domain-containing protein [Seonamhaeicola sediminis]TWO31388.1 carboxypeptidase-like regulatory domain-containing protein [Seonamhaeicola sediminis]